MSIQQTNTTLSLTIPAIPVLAPYVPFLDKPLTIDVPVERLKTSMRLVVIISTYLLFRPHLEKLFRTMTGRQNEEELEVKERIDSIKQQQQQPSSGKKVYAVATPGGQGPVSNSDAAGSSSTPPSTGKSKRRKA